MGQRAGQESDAVTVQEAHALLSNNRRRYALHYLLQHREDQPVSMRELTRQVAAWENDIDPAEVEAAERRRVHISMHQRHLPKLERAGIVDYEGDGVRLGPRAEDLRVHLEVVQPRDISWSEFYLGYALLSGVVIVAAAVGVPPFSAVPPLALGGVIAVGLAVAAAAHLVSNRRNRLGADGGPPL